MSTTNLEEPKITDIVSKQSNIFNHIKFEHLVAGVSGGLTSTLILHPLDLIKIRFEVNDGRHIRSELQYNGIFNAFKTIFTKEGISGLYRGVTPSLWGAGSSWGLYFLLYNSLKSFSSRGLDTDYNQSHLGC
ncbi:mitochondrial folate transporter/carrier-like [Agrilus planipennis]|uniref:Mitochondrial folate transporter/carrier-like n=1 Tax=Agrilus planipennis TaxID=224129 RepID=A0A1W4XF72_AGRPL|nr:mitochondrial folate transporter/carrier-like [Agrilus planipennis]